MEFRARLYGFESDGPALVLLHGFPASSLMWEGLAQEAVRRGLRVLAYDQRGYSPGARPQGCKDYQIKDYLGDLQAITRTLGLESFHLVGHDIGAVVAWSAAMAWPHRLRSLNALSIPNPEVLPIRPYVRLLALPRLPEAILQAGGSRRLRSMLPEGCSAEEAEEYRQILTEPGALTAALNFYRSVNASLRDLRTRLSAPIRVSTRFTYGAGEGWVRPAYLAAQAKRMEPGVPLEVAKIEGAGTRGHFLIETRPELVIEGILDHVQRVERNLASEA